ncbi:MAG: TetR family transcriptional regulator [Jatrophihabitantaceae bacterium]
MGRWQPDARGRLAQAAMELYAERGYEQATVAEIADRAGLTARTFFRYFADKREVLFAGSDALGEQMMLALTAAAATDPPLAAVAAALDVVAELIGADRAYSRRRQAVIVANADLQERELTKLASWSRALADGLRRRGVEEPTASLAAETGVAVFRVAFERWLAGPARRTLVDTLHDSLDQLRTLTDTGTGIGTG